jgi:hypothetical protein
MPFGFGLSMPNLRKVGGAAAPAPVTLVSDTWQGTGIVSGRTPSPTAGGGTWEITANGNPVYYSAGTVYTDAGFGQFRHSVTYTDANISTTVYPTSSLAGDTNVVVYARTNNGPTGDITTGYYAIFKTTGVVSGAASVSLRKLVANVETVISTSAVDPTNLATSFKVIGSTLTVIVGGTQVIQVTDTSIATAGYWGYSVDWKDNTVDASNSIIGAATIKTS